jgi:hypothetical protein
MVCPSPGEGEIVDGGGVRSERQDADGKYRGEDCGCGGHGNSLRESDLLAVRMRLYGRAVK